MGVKDLDLMEKWLTETYDYEPPRKGQVRQGEILKIEEHGVTIDMGLKRDGFVPRTDVERLGEEASSSLEAGQEVMARIVHLEDPEGHLALSLYQARFEKDWTKAEELLKSDEILECEVIDCNRGGLIAQFRHIQGFIPASHLTQRNIRRLPLDDRQSQLADYTGQRLSLKVIEVNRRRRRLILSERLARRQLQEENKERLLSQLVEGQACRGTVSQLRNFGAFVDLGGADGLIHISELAWRRVRHPKEVLQVGEEIDVYVLKLDHERKRIGLSLKRLQPDPWTLVDETYTVDQLVSGVVTNVVDFGAFVALDLGVEGLVHVSELSDPPPTHPREIVEPGNRLVLRILRIDSFRHRIGLSLKAVDTLEQELWLAQQSDEPSADSDSPDATDTDSAVAEDIQTEPNEPEPAVDDDRDTASTASTEQSIEVTEKATDESLWMSLMQEKEQI